MSNNKEKRYTIYSNAQSAFGALKGYMKDLYNTMDEKIQSQAAEITALKHQLEHKEADIFQRDRAIAMLEEAIKRKAM
jgi:hypothetical protein